VTHVEIYLVHADQKLVELHATVGQNQSALLDINNQAISESKLHPFSQTEILPMLIAALVTLKDEKAGSEACL
jgi:hypothetical protein